MFGRLTDWWRRGRTWKAIAQIAREECDELREELDCLRGEYREAIREKGELWDEIGRLERIRCDDMETMKRLTDEKAALSLELEGAHERLGQADAELAADRAKVAVMGEEIDRLRSSLATEKRRFADVVAAKDNLIREVEQLRDDAWLCKQEIASLNGRLDAATTAGDGSWSGLMEGR